MLKKTVSILLAALMCATVLCSCRDTSYDDEQDSATAAGSEEESTSTDDKTSRPPIRTGSDTEETAEPSAQSDSTEQKDTADGIDDLETTEAETTENDIDDLGGNVDASGSFKSSTGNKYLNVKVDWKAKSTSDGIKLTADIYLTSWTVVVAARNDNQITIGSEKMTFKSARVEVNNQYAETLLATVEKVLPAGTASTDITVDYHYSGIYGGVEYDWITASDTIVLN